jgi:membrane protease YdiL (CAAX protease family)
LSVRKKGAKSLNFKPRIDRWLALSFLIPSLILLLTEKTLTILGNPYQSSIFNKGYIFIIAILTTVIGSVGEEIGWRGFMQTEATKELGPFKSSIVTGLLWGLWHVSKIWQAGFISYIIFAINMIPMSIIMGYVFHKSNRSLINMVVYHSMTNLYMMFLLFGRESMRFYFVNIALSLLLVLILFLKDRSYFKEKLALDFPAVL